MNSARVSFPGSSGHALSGRLHRPSGVPRAWAIFAHCFTCTKDLRMVRVIAQGLSARGVGVLRFDFTGLGQSEGEFADTDFSSNVSDLVAAARWLRAKHGAPTVLVGHSLGGAAVLAAVASIPDCRAVVTVGAPSDPAHVQHHLESVAPEIEATGEAVVELAGRPFTVRRSFLEDIRRQRLLVRVSEIEQALLVMHSPQDMTVEIDHARRIYQAARHPKSFISLDGADHLLSTPSDADYVGEVISAWVSRYLPAPASSHQHSNDVEVWAGPDGFANDVAVRGRHRLRADEPVKAGGTDTGPTPYELVLAGLGACTSMTLRMYAEKKGWPLEGVRVHLTHDKQHAKDCADCLETDAARVDVIDRALEIQGPLDEAQRARLLEIADRCPVHRTLSGGAVHIRTSLDGRS